MKISCPSCAAKYSVADEKIQARLAKIRCRKCSATIVIDGTAQPANVYVGDGPVASNAPAEGEPDEPAAPDTGGPAPGEYAVDIADNDQRNMTVAGIVQAYQEGVITGDTYLWKEGMADWQTLAEVPEVAEALHASAGGPAATAQAAVREAFPGGSSADLFGGIEQAGGEDDITTSAPEPAPVTAGTGARNESSVLFSLSALTSAQGAVDESKSATKKSSDDSGLIDLQALTASDSSSSAGLASAPAGSFGASPLISAPLGGVSGPAVGSSLAPGYERRSSSRTGLMVAAGALAVVILGGAAFLVKSGDDSGSSSLEKTASASPTPADSDAKGVNAEPNGAPIGNPTPEAKNIADVAATAGGTAAAGAVAKAAAAVPAPKEAPAPAPVKAAAAAPAKAKPAAPKRTTTKTASKPVSKPTTSTKRTTAPAPTKSAPAKKTVKKKPRKAGCDCKPGDLLCAMKCSARK